MSENRRSTDETISKMAGDVGYIRGRVDDLVEVKRDHERRISAVENSMSSASGEKKSNNNHERFITGVISVVFSAAIALAAAYIDRQTTGDSNANPTFASDTANRPPRPTGNR